MEPTDLEDGMKLAEGMAKRFIRFRPHEREDMIQVAYVGLVAAIQRFDDSHEVPFEKFAAITISGTLKRHIRDCNSIRLPRATKEMIERIYRVNRELGRTATIEEIMEFLDEERDVVEQALVSEHASYVLSADAVMTIDSEETVSIINTIADERDEFGEADARMVIESTELTDLERKTLLMYFEDDMTQAEIGEKLHYTQTHAGRVLNQALSKIKHSLKGVVVK